MRFRLANIICSAFFFLFVATQNRMEIDDRQSRVENRKKKRAHYVKSSSID